MHQYKCRCSQYDDLEWQWITSDDPEIAAETYAEEHGLEVGDIVSVWGVGKFVVNHIYMEPNYFVSKL